MKSLSSAGTIHTGEYVVGSIDSSNRLSVAANPAIHDDIKVAQKEAERLATLKPGTRYIVLCARGVVGVQQVTWMN